MVINKKSIWVLINPISGAKGKKGLEDRLSELIPKDSFDLLIIYTQYSGHATELAKEAAEKNIDIVCVAGGDGSVHEAGIALLGKNTQLAIIPLGSGNGVARHLGIPMQVEKAILQIVNGSVTLVDSGTVNDIPFIGFAGFGFDAHIAAEFAKGSRRGLMGYAVQVVRKLFSYSAISFSVDGVRKHGFMVSCMNVGQFGNNVWIDPLAKANDRELALCILKPFPWYVTPHLLFRLFRKRIHHSPYFERIPFGSITFETENIPECHIDGEVLRLDSSKIIIRCGKEPLKVLC